MREYKDIRVTLGNKDVITAVNILNISTLKLNIFFSEIDQRYYHFIYEAHLKTAEVKPKQT